jgi:two-component system, chemotaxis family, sensor kinase CheA
MPEFDEEMKEIIESFFVETEELLDSLGQDLVKLDQENLDSDLLNGIFRSVHTIKGTSSFLGFGKMSELAHESETIFNRFRKGELQVTSEKMDVIFEAYDILKSILQQIKAEMNDEVDLSDILSKLQLINQEEYIDSDSNENQGNSSLLKDLVSNEDIIEDLLEGISISKNQNIVNPQEKKSSFRPNRLLISEPTIRVGVKRLDKLMNLVGELVLSRNRLMQTILENPDQLEDDFKRNLSESSAQIDFITSEIQRAVMKTRMVVIEKLFKKAPRLVRDLSKELDKKINLQVFGEETELDKTIVEELNDPLIHIIRNAIDHGIETSEEREAAGKNSEGTVILRAEHNGNQILINIEDDGKGLDVEKLKIKALEKGLITETQALEMSKKDALNLIFYPGFSTAERLTSVSGRGVGMDVVKTNISKLKGIIDVESAVGVGTKIILKLPLTLAIIQTLLVKVVNEIFSIPLDSVIEVIRVEPTEIETINGKEVTLNCDSVLPIIRLRDIFNINHTSHKKSTFIYVVIIGLAEKRVGLVVDSLLGQKEVVIKPLGDSLGKLPGISGSTILGDGRVVMIIDVNTIVELSQKKISSAA